MTSDMVITDTHPLVAWDANYTLLIERASGSTHSTTLVSSGDVYQAMQCAMSLARPSIGDVLIVKWDNGTDKRELAVKVLDAK